MGNIQDGQGLNTMDPYSQNRPNNSTYASQYNSPQTQSQLMNSQRLRSSNPNITNSRCAKLVRSNLPPSRQGQSYYNPAILKSSNLRSQFKNSRIPEDTEIYQKPVPAQKPAEIIGDPRVKKAYKIRGTLREREDDSALQEAATKINTALRTYREKKNLEQNRDTMKEEGDDYVRTIKEKLDVEGFPEEDDEYNFDGWKEFYDPEEPEAEYFTRDKGFVLKDGVKVNDPNNNNCGIYEGEVNIENKRHGIGKYTTKDEIKFGNWRNDEFEGWGRITKKNGTVTEARIENDVANGKGYLKNKKGNLYKGPFVDGKREGKNGTLDTQKIYYEGDFANDKLEGHGVIRFKQEGHTFDGTFSNNEINGYGTFKWNNGDVYEGEMQRGKMHGKGIYTYANGQVYDGYYQNGVKQGEGKILFASGKELEGQFQRGLPEGRGRYTKEGVTSTLQFRDGKASKIA